MADTSKQEIKLFYCYAREDKALRDKFEKQMAGLKRYYHLKNWHDREILPGEDWEQAIDEQLNSADIIFLLISPDFMASDYCYGIEMQRALERHKEGTCKVVPIILRPTFLDAAPFNKLQMLPTDKKPITRWPDRDEAFADVTRGISKVIEDILVSNGFIEDLTAPTAPQSYSTSPDLPNKSITLVKFVNDDPGYLKWVRRNQKGFIINASKPEPSSYLKLHRATCAQIISVTRTNYTTTDYFKICSISKSELVDWARKQRGKLETCKICKP